MEHLSTSGGRGEDRHDNSPPKFLVNSAPRPPGQHRERLAQFRERWTQFKERLTRFRERWTQFRERWTQFRERWTQI
jgi:DNA polymerase IIIc chi subunit